MTLMAILQGTFSHAGIRTLGSRAHHPRRALALILLERGCEETTPEFVPGLGARALVPSRVNRHSPRRARPSRPMASRSLAMPAHRGGRPKSPSQVCRCYSLGVRQIGASRPRGSRLIRRRVVRRGARLPPPIRLLGTRVACALLYRRSMAQAVHAARSWRFRSAHKAPKSCSGASSTVGLNSSRTQRSAPSTLEGG